jgi:hypothetical protein
MHRILCLLMVVLVSACGGGGAGSSAQPSTTTAARTRGPSDLITEAEVNAGAYQHALEVVQNLRPQMLIPRGVGSDASGLSATSIPIIVYMDDVRLGEVQSLVNIPANRIKEIRFLNSRDATTRFGTGHSSGVILVTTKR